MKLTLTHPEVRDAIRQYVASKGFVLAVPKTVNQNTGLKFYWDIQSADKLKVEIELKEAK